MRKLKFSFKEVALLTACGVVLGASLMVLGERHMAKKAGGVV